MIQQMLAIWSLVLLPFLKPAWNSGSSWFTYYWSLASRILSIILVASEMSAIVWCLNILWHYFSLGLEWKHLFQSCGHAEFSKFSGILSAALSQDHLSGFEIAQLEFHHLHKLCSLWFFVRPTWLYIADVWLYIPGERIDYPFQYSWASMVAQRVKNPPAMWVTWVRSWVGKIPWRRTCQPIPVFLTGGVQSMGSQS